MLAACEAEASLKLNYIWPGWRKVHADLRRELKKEQERTACAEDPDDGTDEEDEKPDPVVALQRERDNLDRQVRAATQQFRNERARREEVEEQLAALRERLAGRDAQIAALRAQLAGKQQVGPDFILVGEVTPLKPRPRRAPLLLPGPTTDPDLRKKRPSAGRPIGESRAETASADPACLGHIIYSPKGQALEYAALATSPYLGCDPSCPYCFVPRHSHIKREVFDAGAVSRRDHLSLLRRVAAKYPAAGINKQVLISFMTVKPDLRRYPPPGFPNSLRIQLHH